MSRLDEDSEPARWMRYALEDLSEAEFMVSRADFVPRHPCWLSQQCVEKALKAVLIQCGIRFPRTHDLDTLLNMIPSDWGLRKSIASLAVLTQWAVETRYPGDWPLIQEQDAHNSVSLAREIFNSISNEFLKRGAGLGF